MTPEQLRRLADLVDDLEMDGYQIEDAELLERRDDGVVAAVELSLSESDEDATAASPESTASASGMSTFPGRVPVSDGEDTVMEDNVDDSPEEDDADEPKNKAEDPDGDETVELTDAEQEVVDVLKDEGELPSSEIRLLTGLSDYLAKVLSRLRDKGVLEYRKDPDDGRRYLYSLATDDVVDENPDGADPPDDADGAESNFESEDERTERDYDGDLVVEDLDEVGEVRERSLRQQVRAADGDVTDEQLAVQIGATVEVVQLLRSDVEAIDASSERDTPSESSSPSSTSRSSGSTSVECQNCGAHVSQSYADVFTPEDVEDPRVCPSCPDKIREGDGSIRDARSSRSSARRVDQ